MGIFNLEVVLIEKAFPDSKAKTAKGHFGGVVGKADPADVRHAEVLAVDMKPIQVRVAPAHGNLNRVVEISDRLVTTQV